MANRRKLYQLRLLWTDGAETYSRVYSTREEASRQMKQYLNVALIYGVEMEEL